MRTGNLCGSRTQSIIGLTEGVATISGFVLLEKITSANQLVSRLGGLLFIGWAAWIVFGS